ncbi:hypothetical protein KC874_05405, partial [Candidatus Saccharibacteria bacterium]|nr:hypothetical protein [Candidatus Saccharibacteria bacterium]
EVYDFLADFSAEELQKFDQLAVFDHESTETNLQTITRLVHQKYRHKKKPRGALALNAEKIAQDREVDCYGYTIALSQVLAQKDIDHKIAYGNGHSFVVADVNSDLFILDALVPEISGLLQPQNICHRHCYEDNVFSLDMISHINQVSFGQQAVNPQDILLAQRWTHFRKNQDRFGSGGRESYIVQTKNSSIIVRSYQPESGITALYAYDQYKASVYNDRLPEAYYLSKVLENYYPNLDIRNKPQVTEKLITRLGKLGLDTLASLTIDRTAHARELEQTIAQQIWRSDQYRKIYVQNKGKEWAKEKATNILSSLLLNATLTTGQKIAIKGKLIYLAKL